MKKILIIFESLSRRRRVQIVLLVVLMCLGIAAELSTIGALLPFLAIIVSDQSFEIEPIATLIKLLNDLGLNGDPRFQITLIFIILAIASGFLRILLSLSTTRLSFSIGVDLGASLFQAILSLPYDEHKKINSSEIIAVLTKKSDDVVFGVIYPLIVMVTALSTLIAILIFLALINLAVTVVTLVIFTLFYLGILSVTRKSLAKNSSVISSEQSNAINIIQVSVGGIREIILHNLHNIYVKSFISVSSRLKKSQGDNIFLTTTPRYAIETFMIVIIATGAYSYLSHAGAATSLIPTLGAFVLGAQRLLPSAQQIYWAIANIKGCKASLDDVVVVLENSRARLQKNAKMDCIKFNSNIAIKDYTYSHPGSQSPLIKKCTFTINKLDRIGFIGETGSGKSTLIDLIMCLMPPDSGSIFVDGVNVDDDNLRAYQSIIAHVPQSIYLVDGTVAQNIAFEITGEQIDMERVIMAASVSQAHQFICNLPDKYMTRVGERGSLLSGGQCQRIGIARALYKNPQLLILDEATSALDQETEEQLIKSLSQIKGLTILMIAHRLKSLSCCNRIFEVAEGCLQENKITKELTS